MAKDKIDRQTAIKSILSDLKKGVDKKTILQKLSKTYTNSTKSFYNYFDVAELQYSEYTNRITPIKEKAEEDAVYEATKEIVKTGILSKAERMQLLSDIATGKVKTWKQAASMGHVVTLETYDPAKYISELNKMDGSYLNDIKEDDFNGFEIEEI